MCYPQIILKKLSKEIYIFQIPPTILLIFPNVNLPNSKSNYLTKNQTLDFHFNFNSNIKREKLKIYAKHSITTGQ